MEKVVLVVGGGQNYYTPFKKFGAYSEDISVLRKPTELVQKIVSLVLFTGGEDVDPMLYGDCANPKTYYNTKRDVSELFVFKSATAHNLPKVGVCRGSQFLCAVSGGKLVQHVEGHSGNHRCKLWDGRVITVSSTHHQMQLPPKDAVLLGWAENKLSKTHQDGQAREIDIDKEAEIVYYPSTRSIGMQHHPEMQYKTDDGHLIAAEVVETYLMSNG